MEKNKAVKSTSIKRLLIMAIAGIMVCLALQVTVQAKAYDGWLKTPREFSSQSKSQWIRDLRDIITTQILPGAGKNVSIKLLVHFADGDYIYNNAKGTFKKYKSGSGSSSKKLAAPQKVKVKLTAKNKVKISWKKVKGAKSYKIYRKVGSGQFKLIKQLKKNSYLDTGLKPGKKITYYITGVNSKKKEGKKSAKKSITTPASNKNKTSDFEKTVKITGFKDLARKTVSVSYRDDYFKESAHKENKELISLSAAACAATYASGQTKRFLQNCGFDKIKTKETGISKEGVNKNDNAKYWFGVRKNVWLNGKKYCIIAAVLSGYTSNSYEWVSNFNLGTGNIHKGFNIAANKLIKALKEYISLNASDEKNIKIWITGHSRGGAMSNLVGASMSDLYQTENVYVYGFATPRYIRDKGGKKYKNIYNYINPDDMVPEVAPRKWGYRRYGNDIILQNREKMKKEFLRIVGRDYGGMTDYEREEVVNVFAAFGGSIEDYAVKKYDVVYVTGKTIQGITAAEFAQKGIGLAMAKGSGGIIEKIQGKVQGASTILSGYTFEDKKGSDLTSALLENIIGICNAHAMGTYIAHINANYGGLSIPDAY